MIGANDGKIVSEIRCNSVGDVHLLNGRSGNSSVLRDILSSIS